MRIPDGAEFDNPAANNHFSSVFVFHKESRTIHDDDTLMYFDPCNLSCCLRLAGATPGKLYFHPSLATGGLHKFQESSAFFKAWVLKLINDWDFVNICTAHNGILMGNGKKLLRQTLRRYENKFRRMSRIQSTRINVNDPSSGTLNGKSRGKTASFSIVWQFQATSLTSLNLLLLNLHGVGLHSADVPGLFTSPSVTTRSSFKSMKTATVHIDNMSFKSP